MCYLDQLQKCTHILRSGCKSQIWWQFGAQITKTLAGVGLGGWVFPPLLFSTAVPTPLWIAWDFPSTRRSSGGRKAGSSASWSPGQHKGLYCYEAGSSIPSDISSVAEGCCISAIGPQMHSKKSRPVVFCTRAELCHRVRLYKLQDQMSRRAALIPELL